MKWAFVFEACHSSDRGRWRRSLPTCQSFWQSLHYPCCCKTPAVAAVRRMHGEVLPCVGTFHIISLLLGNYRQSAFECIMSVQTKLVYHGEMTRADDTCTSKQEKLTLVNFDIPSQRHLYCKHSYKWRHLQPDHREYPERRSS